jgi:Fic family protein
LQSIGSSTRIEGATLSDAEVATFLKNIKITKFDTRDEQEVGGYFDVLNLILDDAASIELTENNILSLHNLLMKHSTKDAHHRGKYKQLTNQVVANYPDGSQRIVFKTTEVFLAPKETSELITWTNTAFQGEDHHALIIIGAFIYEFLSIHPFQDGNGRLSRLLTTLLLSQKGYNFIQYVSFENLIENRKKDYYRALIDGQKNRYKKEEKIDNWLIFFLDCLMELGNRLENKYEEMMKRGGYLSARRQEIRDFISSKNTVQMGDIVTYFPQTPRSTLKADLRYLVQEYYLEKSGEGKGTVYFAKKK